MSNRWVISWLVIDYWRWSVSNRWVIETQKFCGLSITHRWHRLVIDVIGPLQDPVTLYGINYTGTQMTQWDFQNKGKSCWTGKDSFVLSLSASFASQCNLFLTMWPGPAKGLLITHRWHIDYSSTIVLRTKDTCFLIPFVFVCDPFIWTVLDAFFLVSELPVDDVEQPVWKWN